MPCKTQQRSSGLVKWEVMKFTVQSLHGNARGLEVYSSGVKRLPEVCGDVQRESERGNRQNGVGAM